MAYRARAVASARPHVSFFRLRLANQLVECEALTDDLADSQVETILVLESHAVIITEGLFVQIAEKVERLNRNIRAVNTTFQEAPEILKLVRMDLPAHILYGVVHDFMLKFIEAVLGLQGVREQRGTG